jgi:hypothetical protein
MDIRSGRLCFFFPFDKNVAIKIWIPRRNVWSLHVNCLFCRPTLSKTGRRRHISVQLRCTNLSNICSAILLFCYLKQKTDNKMEPVVARLTLILCMKQGSLSLRGKMRYLAARHGDEGLITPGPQTLLTIIWGENSELQSYYPLLSRTTLIHYIMPDFKCV